MYHSASSFSSISLRLPTDLPYFWLVFWFPAEQFCGWLSTLLDGLLIGLSVRRYAFAPRSRDFLGKVDVKPGIARFFLDVKCYVPESYFISMVASHNFKWDRCAAWQFRCSPSCVLAFGCCGGATPVGLPFGSSSLIFISAAFVSSIGLLYSFTDLSLCTCIILFSFASIVVAFPILAFAGFFTSFSYSYIHFCSLYLDSSAHALPSPSTRWTFHFVPTFVHSDSPFLAIIITKI